MTREDGIEKRRQQLLDRLGSEEAVKQYYRDLQAKSRKTYKGTGGFRHMKETDPERLKQVAAKGGRKGKNVPD